jgi:hypothetical protein
MIRNIRNNGPVNTEQNYLIIVEIVEFPHFLYFIIFKNYLCWRLQLSITT